MVFSITVSEDAKYVTLVHGSVSNVLVSLVDVEADTIIQYALFVTFI